jgi:hypothetical protein
VEWSWQISSRAGSEFGQHVTVGQWQTVLTSLSACAVSNRALDFRKKFRFEKNNADN